MAAKTISPQEAHRMIADGAVLVDVRQPQEIDREMIEGAIAAPLSSLRAADLEAARDRKAIFFCHSGARTRMLAGQIEAKASGICEPYYLAGGIVAWRRAGLPTVAVPRPPGLLARLFGQ
ncbi:rhodanese-related sulfurtransferase [Rhodopseudomonas faecalis]|uniref:Rhodanese-related sulfurtransferase n=1 Tax=Rhodopseudomonas faecalis TaxID=99655 RepID=A0A318TJ95_9BRAD|nr:rhodanese-like domain-containing protein [Rhodopseudomonas faecalis]PYF01935.1 rhodanese-related sulfurtransferase [Rhodopseudomonas faecalis]TAH66672.1 MAG: sulfurtransferase [Rhodopseudomonas palustris]